MPATPACCASRIRPSRATMFLDRMPTPNSASWTTPACRPLPCRVPTPDAGSRTSSMCPPLWPSIPAAGCTWAITTRATPSTPAACWSSTRLHARQERLAHYGRVPRAGAGRSRAQPAGDFLPAPGGCAGDFPLPGTQGHRHSGFGFHRPDPIFDPTNTGRMKPPPSRRSPKASSVTLPASAAPPPRITRASTPTTAIAKSEPQHFQSGPQAAVFFNNELFVHELRSTIVSWCCRTRTTTSVRRIACSARTATTVARPI